MKYPLKIMNSYSLKKTNYVNKAAQLFENHTSFLALRTQNVSAAALQKKLKEAKQRGIKVLHFRRKVLRKVMPEVPLKDLKFDYLCFSNDFDDLISYAKESIKQKVFVKPGSKLDKDLILQKGPTKVKAGVNLALFQQVGNIKITKGFIELLEPLKLVVAHQPVTEVASQVLKILRRRQKENSSEAIALGTISERIELISDLLKEGLLNPFKGYEKTQKVLKAVCVGSKCFRFNVMNRTLNICVLAPSLVEQSKDK